MISVIVFSPAISPRQKFDKGLERGGNFLLPQPLQKLLKWASSCISDGLTRTQEIGNRWSNFKILVRYIIPFLTGLFLLRETTF